MHSNDFNLSALWAPKTDWTSTRSTTPCGVCFRSESYHTKISDIDELKRRIISKWAALSHTVIDSAVKE